MQEFLVHSSITLIGVGAAYGLHRLVDRWRHPRKVLETFECYVSKVEGDVAYIDITSRLNGDSFHGHYSAAELAALGIGEEDQFLFRTIDRRNGVDIEIERIPPVELTPEDCMRIKAEIDAVLGDFDPGDDY